MYPLPTVPTVGAVPRTQTWESKVLLRPSGQLMYDWTQLKLLYGRMILAGGCGDLLILGLSKTSPGYKFLCLLDLPPTSLECLFHSLVSFSISYQFSSVQFSHSVMSDSLRPHELQHTRPLCPSPTPRVHSDSCPLSQWCHPAISSSVIPFSSCPQSLPTSESFPMSQFFKWGGQSTGVSASASFLPEKSQGCSPSEWTGWISLQSKGLSRVFSNTTVQKHQVIWEPNCEPTTYWPQIAEFL